MLPKELLDLLHRIMGRGVNTEDIEAVSIEWNIDGGLDINVKYHRR